MTAAAGGGRGAPAAYPPGGGLRILLVSTEFGLGGAERQVQLLARAFAERGHEVRWAGLQDPGPFLGDVSAIGIPIIGLGMRRGRADLRGIVRLAREVQRFRPHVVHSHMVHANLLARVTRLAVPMPVLIATAHNVNEGPRWRELAYRLTDPLCTLTTNVSRAAVERYIRVGAVPARKIRYVPNGLDLSRLAPIEPAARRALRPELGPDGAFLWLAAGRLADAKDYPTMLRGVLRLLRERPGAALAVAGDGPERAALEALRRELCLPAERVRFLGVRHDLPALMQAADAFVMSSAWEGLPMVLLEASASRLPVVATAVGGNPEAVLDGRSGSLVPPREPAALAAAMLRVMAMPDAARAAWGEAGRRHVEREYGLERVVDGWLDTYRELLPVRRSPLPALRRGV